MLFDPETKIVQLCAKGMEYEGTGDPDHAKQLFEGAWQLAATDAEKMTAAHYVARHQPTQETTLHWNLEALRYADNIADEELAGIYPSLYLNVAHNYETLGNREAAIKYYRLAESAAKDLPDDGYGNMIRGGIREGLKRTDV